MDFRRNLESLLELSSGKQSFSAYPSVADVFRTKSARVVLFGAGSLGRKVASSLRRRGINPLAFSDNSPLNWGRQVDLVPVLSPFEAAQRFGCSAMFVVTIASPGHAFAETQRQLTNLGCTHIIPFLPLLGEIAEELLPYYAFHTPAYFSSNASSILSGFDMMADDKSRETYFNNIRFRLLADFSKAPSPDAGRQYFAEDIFQLGECEAFVDAGAYNGDTLREFFLRVPNGSAYAFEPDPENFGKLVSYVQDLSEDHRQRIQCRSLALGDCARSMRFTAKGGPEASISPDGTLSVDMVRLDDLPFATAPTFLKLDIEGGEYKALLGSSKFISSQKPLIAVCVYHRPDDLWSLTNLLHSLNPDYRFHLRVYDHDGWETVLYAVNAN